ncbi:MAG: Dna2/Cas4 domain-containing protein [Oligoflexia bacterium]|nr:Dna2/Cas4 domain-containing protein [Oligoflexia bacterium]
MKQIPKLLSKTRLMRGYQCLKSIYLTIHNKGLEPPVTPDLQAIFDQGNVVGAEARKKYPEGVLVDFPAWDFFGSLKKTRELLKIETEVIFEAAFEYKGCYARADIISYSKETKRWSVYEVKSTTKVKDEHLDDVGLQAWIMANAGLPIEKISIMHLNSSCRYPNLKNLFTEVDVTEELRNRHTSILPRLTEIFKTIRLETIPNIDIGPHCSSPNDCPFSSHCWREKQIPNLSVFNLPGIKANKWELYSN